MTPKEKHRKLGDNIVEVVVGLFISALVILLINLTILNG